MADIEVFQLHNRLGERRFVTSGKRRRRSQIPARGSAPGTEGGTLVNSERVRELNQVGEGLRQPLQGCDLFLAGNPG